MYPKTFALKFFVQNFIHRKLLDLMYVRPFKFRLSSVLGPFNFRPPPPTLQFSKYWRNPFQGKSTASDVVGHIPREISRFCHFFLHYGGALEGRVRDNRYTLRVQKYGNDGLKNGGKDVLWPISLVTKGRFSLQPRPQFKLLWRENIRHLVFCLSNRQGQILEKLFMNFETKTSK